MRGTTLLILSLLTVSAWSGEDAAWTQQLDRLARKMDWSPCRLMQARVIQGDAQSAAYLVLDVPSPGPDDDSPAMLRPAVSRALYLAAALADVQAPFKTLELLFQHPPDSGALKFSLATCREIVQQEQALGARSPLTVQRLWDEMDTRPLQRLLTVLEREIQVSRAQAAKDDRGAEEEARTRQRAMAALPEARDFVAGAPAQEAASRREQTRARLRLEEVGAEITKLKLMAERATGETDRDKIQAAHSKAQSEERALRAQEALATAGLTRLPGQVAAAQALLNADRPTADLLDAYDVAFGRRRNRRSTTSSSKAATQKGIVAPDVPPPQAAPAKLEAEETAKQAKLAAMPVYILRDGRRIRAAMVMDLGEEYSIKDEAGKMHTVKKADVAEIQKP